MATPNPNSKIVFAPVSDPIYVHALASPVTYGASSIAEIAFRKPNSRDLLFIGSPVIADPTSGKEATLDFAKVVTLASALSGLPEKVFVEQVEPVDIVDLGWKLGSFFIPGWQDLLPEMKRSKDLSSAPPGQPEGSPESTPELPSST